MTTANGTALGLANGHLGDLVAANEREGYFTVGLLANCSSLSGMLAGLQHSGPTRRPLRVGLVFIDAHGDYNTPETTLSGMLGGMPVAVAAGHALTNIRAESGLNPALPTSYIVMSCVRDTDPLEQERIDRSDIEMIPVGDIRALSQNIHDQMRRLSETTDIIYIHIDMDVLDPSEVPGHPLTVPGWPDESGAGGGADRDVPVREDRGARPGVDAVRRRRPRRPLAPGGLQPDRRGDQGRSGEMTGR